MKAADIFTLELFSVSALVSTFCIIFQNLLFLCFWHKRQWMKVLIQNYMMYEIDFFFAGGLLFTNECNMKLSGFIESTCRNIVTCYSFCCFTDEKHKLIWNPSPELRFRINDVLQLNSHSSFICNNYNDYVPWKAKNILS